MKQIHSWKAKIWLKKDTEGCYKLFLLSTGRLPREELDHLESDMEQRTTVLCSCWDLPLPRRAKQSKGPVIHIMVTLPLGSISSRTQGNTRYLWFFNSQVENMLFGTFFPSTIKCFHYIAPMKRGTCFIKPHKWFFHFCFFTLISLSNLALIFKEEDTFLSFHFMKVSVFLVEALQKYK